MPIVVPTLGRPHREVSRRTLLGGGAALLGLVLTACSSDADTASSSSAPGYPRRLRTPYGEVELTTEPRRVVALNGNQVTPFVLPFLGGGVELVGYGARTPLEFTPWIAEELADVQALDYGDGPDLEAIAALSPDVVLGNYAADFWEPAAQVAPLVQFDPVDWRGSTTLLGELFGQQSQAADTIAATEQLIADARRGAPATAAIVYRYDDPTSVYMEFAGSALGDLLGELGVTVAPPPDAEPYATVSLELAAQYLDVDHVLVLDFSSDEAAAGAQDALLADPLFAGVPAVAAGRVVRLDATQTVAANPPSPATIPVVLDAIRPVLA